MTILVSACLLGTACRYDGRSKADAAVTALLARHTLIPVCGEIFGGLPTPRTPAERRGARVMTKDGRDVTDAYRRGAEEVVRLARLYGARAAILTERSPSCGSGEIYDGTFSGTRTAGWGVTVQEIGEPCEIVSLDGTVSAARCHVHIALAREDLSTLGGHLMPGCIVNTTCELALLALDGWRFGVEQDSETGYDEIVFREAER